MPAKPRPVIPVSPDDRVELRKSHACGGSEWRVTRVGMDIGLECATCGRRVMIPRSQFERQLRGAVKRAAEAEGPQPAPAPEE